MSATGMGAATGRCSSRACPGFVHIQTCYPYRFQGARPGETVGQAAARELEEAILREGPDTVAAFIGEPIHGAGGVIYPTDDYWPRVREVCTRHNVLLIADEVITGFCRTGRWFALSHWNVKPDILTFAKGVTSGYLPLGGIMVTKAIKDAMDSVKPEDRWMHAYTYSGHPTCCAVGAEEHRDHGARAALGERGEDGHAAARGPAAAFGDHPHAGDIRGGKGLLAAVELVEDRATKKNFAGDKKVAQRIQAEMMKRGVVTRTRPSPGPASGTGRLGLLRAAAGRHRGGGRPADRRDARRREGRARRLGRARREADHRPPHPHHRGDRVLSVLRDGRAHARPHGVGVRAGGDLAGRRRRARPLLPHAQAVGLLVGASGHREAGARPVEASDQKTPAVLIYDGECAMCRASALWLMRLAMAGGELEILPCRSAPRRHPVSAPHRRSLHDRHAARPARWPHARGRRRRARASPPHSRTGMAGDGLRAPWRSPGCSPRLRLDRPEPHASLLRALRRATRERADVRCALALHVSSASRADSHENSAPSFQEYA